MYLCTTANPNSLAHKPLCESAFIGQHSKPYHLYLYGSTPNDVTQSGLVKSPFSARNSCSASLASSRAPYPCHSNSANSQFLHFVRFGHSKIARHRRHYQLYLFANASSFHHNRLGPQPKIRLNSPTANTHTSMPHNFIIRSINSRTSQTINYKHTINVKKIFLRNESVLRLVGVGTLRVFLVLLHSNFGYFQVFVSVRCEILRCLKRLFIDVWLIKNLHAKNQRRRSIVGHANRESE